MTDPIFILSYVVLFGGTLAMAGYLIWLDRRSRPGNDHPAPGE